MKPSEYFVHYQRYPRKVLLVISAVAILITITIIWNTSRTNVVFLSERHHQTSIIVNPARFVADQYDGDNDLDNGEYQDEYQTDDDDVDQENIKDSEYQNEYEHYDDNYSEFEHEQQERRKMLQNVCKKLKSDQNQKDIYDQFVASKNDKTFMIDPNRFHVSSEHNLIWCKIAKAASSTWSELLVKLQQTPEEQKIQLSPLSKYHNALGAFTNKQKRFLRQSKKDLKENWYERQPDSPWSVIVVRDPWQRIESAYRSKVLKQARQYRRLYPEMYDNKSKPLGFPSFLHSLLSERDVKPDKNGWAQSTNFSILGGNAHFMPMFGLCDPCKFRYDFILKVENLQEETTDVLNYLNLIEGNASLLNINPSSDAKKPKSSDMSKGNNTNNEEVDIKTGKLFELLHHMDFEMFGYSMQYTVE